MNLRSQRVVLLACTIGALLIACDPEPVVSTGGGMSRGAALPPDAPRVTLRVSGNLGGYLKPCGCASGQMGGLARRAFRNKVDARNVDVFLEGGNLIKQAGELEFAKLYTSLEVLSQGDHPYDAIGLAALDLTMRGDLDALLPHFNFVASDLVQADGKPWQDEGEPVVAAFREKKLEKTTVRIASLVMSLPEGDAGKGLKLLSPQDGWARAMKGAADATLRVLMLHTTGKEAKTLTFDPKPDLIVAINNDYTEPPMRALDGVGDVPIVFVGIHGRLLLDVTIARGPKGAVVTKYQPIPLKGSQTVKDAMRDEAALAVIQGHREMVKEDGMLERLAGKKKLPGKARYVGAAKCGQCHDDDEDTCAKHAHTTAWQTLVEAEKREKWPVTHYPECVSCHVVGYGYESGFVTPKKTPKLLNVTCENCHGPGSVHSANDTLPMPIKPKPEHCAKCHNFEHSPRFEYKKYWEKIEHGK